MIQNHTSLLNYLISRYNLKSYLEIGVQNPANNFDKVTANVKIGVDPEITQTPPLFKCTSDEFFKLVDDKCPLHFFAGPQAPFEVTGLDLIFIDGLHHSDQVKRDFENSLKCLNEGGFIVLHDACPDEEQYTIVPRQTRKWFGDVYKFAMNLHFYGLRYLTLDIDCGITICWKKDTGYLYTRNDIDRLIKSTTWEHYIGEQRKYLNIIPPANLETSLP